MILNLLTQSRRAAEVQSDVSTGLSNPLAQSTLILCVSAALREQTVCYTLTKDKNYSTWLNEVKTKVRLVQIKAAVKVNAELLWFYQKTMLISVNH